MRLQRLPFFIASLWLAMNLSNIALAESNIDIVMPFGPQLGQSVAADMICIKGPCLTPTTSLKALRSFVKVSTYKRALDYTHLGAVEITAPEYDFHKNSLFRVRFLLQCSPEYALENMAAAADELIELLDLTNEKYFSGKDDDDRGHFLWNEQGVLAIIMQEKVKNRWHQPAVKIYQFDQMEQIRSAFNPYYTAKAWPPVAD